MVVAIEVQVSIRTSSLSNTIHLSFTSNEPPFDRHDWIIRRPKTGEEVRYVIDYYSAPPEPDGSPVFSLDVRPALDSFGSLKERIAFATEEAWASVRQNKTPDMGHSVRRDS
jgi:cytochrome c heme-lyase